MKISSPMPSGSGAIVVHNNLANHLDANYTVRSYSPFYEYFPFMMRGFSDANADIIHTTPDYGFLHKRSNQHLVVTLHNYVLDAEMIPFSSMLQRLHYKTDLRLFTRLSLEKADTVTAVSQFVADKTKEDLGFKGDIHVIPNGIDEKLFVPQNKQPENIPGKRTKVLFSGNLSARKGANWIIPILERLDPNIDILYTSGLRKHSTLEKHRRLKCLGSIASCDMPQVYQQADILLFPTVREGFGLAAAEAMACALPVVTTNCSALPELVHHEKGGYLCSIGAVDDFANKINYLSRSLDLRVKMGKYNRQRIEESYTMTKMVLAYENLFYNT